jgi:hypothetical protein
MTLEQIINAHEMDPIVDTYPDTHPAECATDADYPGWSPAMGCVKAPVSLVKQ